MKKIRIIKKNDEFNSDYDIGDIFEVTGTWYGGVHIEGKSGVPGVPTGVKKYITPASGIAPQRPAAAVLPAVGKCVRNNWDPNNRTAGQPG